IGRRRPPALRVLPSPLLARRPGGAGATGGARIARRLLSGSSRLVRLPAAPAAHASGRRPAQRLFYARRSRGRGTAVLAAADVSQARSAAAAPARAARDAVH